MEAEECNSSTSPYLIVVFLLLFLAPPQRVAHPSTIGILIARLAQQPILPPSLLFSDFHSSSSSFQRHILWALWDDGSSFLPIHPFHSILWRILSSKFMIHPPENIPFSSHSSSPRPPYVGGRKELRWWPKPKIGVSVLVKKLSENDLKLKKNYFSDPSPPPMPLSFFCRASPPTPFALIHLLLTQLIPGK